MVKYWYLQQIAKPEVTSLTGYHVTTLEQSGQKSVWEGREKKERSEKCSSVTQISLASAAPPKSHMVSRPTCTTCPALSALSKQSTFDMVTSHCISIFNHNKLKPMQLIRVNQYKTKKSLNHPFTPSILAPRRVKYSALNYHSGIRNTCWILHSVGYHQIKGNWWSLNFKRVDCHFWWENEM